MSDTAAEWNLWARLGCSWGFTGGGIGQDGSVSAFENENLKGSCPRRKNWSFAPTFVQCIVGKWHLQWMAAAFLRLKGIALLIAVRWVQCFFLISTPPIFKKLAARTSGRLVTFSLSCILMIPQTNSISKISSCISCLRRDRGNQIYLEIGVQRFFFCLSHLLLKRHWKTKPSCSPAFLSPEMVLLS